MRTRLALFITILFFITTVGALLLSPRLLLTRVGAQQPAVVFQSTWDTATGTSREAVTDGGRWPDYWEFNRNTGVQLLSVVPDGVNGHHALRVEQRGSALAANLQLDDFIAPSHDYYLRYYMRNDDTSRAADHVVTVDTYQYPNLTFMRKAGGPTGWNIISSFYGCGYTYPIGHWGPAQKLSNGEWYRFEYFVHFVDATHVRVHPRVYDAAGTLIMSEDDFRQSDFGSAVWNGRNTWTLSSYYAAGNAFCVQPQWTNDFGLGNNGQQGATVTGLAWYFSAVEIRTDGWPGPDSIASAGHTSSGGGLSHAYPGDVGIEHDPRVVFTERFDEPTLGDVFRNWTDVRNGAAMTLSVDAPPEDAGGHSLEIRWLGGGVSDGGHLFEELSPGADQVLYVRYYVKFPPAGRYRRAGVWMGGLNPPLPAPDLQDGIRPNGQDRFAAAAERDSATAQIGSVDYWTGMRPSADGQYAGNLLLANPTAQAPAGRWTCVEHAVRLNDPAASNGEHAIWLDGAKVSGAGPGFPNGTWSGNTFSRDAGGAPFEGYRWRTVSSLRLNWIWLLADAPGNAAGSNGSVRFAHVVAATGYIGCMAPR